MSILDDDDIYDFGRAELDKMEERLNECKLLNKALREKLAESHGTGECLMALLESCQVIVDRIDPMRFPMNFVDELRNQIQKAEAIKDKETK